MKMTKGNKSMICALLKKKQAKKGNVIGNQKHSFEYLST